MGRFDTKVESARRKKVIRFYIIDDSLFQRGVVVFAIGAQNLMTASIGLPKPGATILSLRKGEMGERSCQVVPYLMIAMHGSEMKHLPLQTNTRARATIVHNLTAWRSFVNLFCCV